MKRRIIEIDRTLCTGCGLCAGACHEGAVGMVDGKAVLLREDFCDGLGDCLPVCPAGAIRFVEREAEAYSAEAVRAAKEKRPEAAADAVNELRNWPIQLKLVPVRSPAFGGAELLIAADCTAFACANLHRDLIRGRSVVIACPKLDGTDYSGKLADIFSENDIRGVTVLRMTVPCCGGLVFAVREALRLSGKALPLRVRVVSPEGEEIPE